MNAATLSNSLLLVLTSVREPNPPLVDLAARLHPVLVHFPIALLFVAAGSECLRLIRRNTKVSPVSIACCLIGAASAAAAAGSGWINAATQIHDSSQQQAVDLHRWVGLAAAALGVLGASLAIALRRNPGRRVSLIYAAVLTLAAAGSGVAGHLGGSLVYGEDYLADPLRRLGVPVPTFGSVKAEDSASASKTLPGEKGVRNVTSQRPRRDAPAGTVLSVDWQTQIRPIFETRCFSCHGEAKQRGRLRLDILAEVFAEEEQFWCIRPGDPDQSELMFRIAPDTDAEHRMPPKGDRLSEAQSTMIATWIREGAWEGVAKAEQK
jgi:uncharacterized membrane protein/mono/diheme cytochrome c family protein